MTEAVPVVEVDGVVKAYRLYHRQETTLKAAILRRRRGVYEEFFALKGVSFRVPAGQAIGIIGRNGSGKSTLLKVLARIIEPDRGRVRTEGRVAALLEVGAGFQPEYSAIENIFLSGAVYGVPRRELEKRVGDIIAFADLERFADNPVKTYSSGMYTRLGFSIAVNVDPDVLLIDEVLAVGDAAFAARSLDRMLEFRDQGKTLILVTHDLGAVESFCDRAIWIDEGTVRDDGYPHHVIQRYVDEVNLGEERRQAKLVQARGHHAVEHQPVFDDADVVLREMRFLDAEGQPNELFLNGRPLTIEIEYAARRAIQAPVCTVTVDRHDRTRVTTASTRTGGLDLDELPAGHGVFRWEVADLTLTPGTYYFTVQLMDARAVRLLDEHRHWYSIRVGAGRYRDRHGVTVLPGEWSVQLAADPLGDRPDMQVVPAD